MLSCTKIHSNWPKSVAKRSPIAEELEASATDIMPVTGRGLVGHGSEVKSPEAESDQIPQLLQPN
jgi:hypothetical protein